MKNIYVILGSARTGSNWLADLMAYRSDHQRYLKQKKTMQPAGICNAIKTENDTIRGIQNALQYCNNIVVHTHNKHFINDFNLDPKDVILVISKRRDVFAAIMSNIIGRVTNEYVGYTNKQVQPFNVEPKQFLALKNYYDHFYDDINFSLPYKKTTTVFYEDMQHGGVTHLMEKLDIPVDTTYRYSYVYGPSPYNYKNIVSNWEELYELYLLS